MQFNLMPDKDDEHEIVSQISSGVSFRGANLWVLIFAIFIASLGLNVNSTAVIIGAMLISPLMGPIIGMGLAVGTNDLDLLRRAAKNFGVATLFPQVSAFSLARVTEVSRDSMPTRSYVAAIIQVDDKSLSQIDGQKLHDWLRTRIKADSIVVIKKD